MKIYFGPSKPPHITEKDNGFVLRLYAGCRGSNKQTYKNNKEKIRKDAKNNR